MPPRRPRAVNVPPPKKRKKLGHSTQEITFNVEERQDYLSGFHKRKVQRQKQAKIEATKREREDKLAARKNLREERRADLERHVEAVNAVLRDEDGAEAIARDTRNVSVERLGDDREKAPKEDLQVDRELEYEDEDISTMVTVEAVEVDRDGFKKIKANREEDEEQNSDVVPSEKPSDDALHGAVHGQDVGGKARWTKETPRNAKLKVKKKPFKYESKADRKVTRFKSRAKGKKQAKERKSR